MNSINNIESLVNEHGLLAKCGVNVHKFGGSSLANTTCIERVVNIIAKHCKPNDFIVVSANGKTTDALIVNNVHYEMIENVFCNTTVDTDNILLETELLQV